MIKSSIKCQAEDKIQSFNSSDAKKIAFLLTPLMMWQIDNDGNVLNINQLLLDFLGAKAGDKLNIFDPAVINPPDYHACCATFANGKAQKSPFETTRGLKCHTGKYYTYTAKVT
jgi:PAS domain-containing protein